MSLPRTAVAERWWLSAWRVVPFVIAAVLASRLPAIWLASELNPDESQMLAQAMRLGIDPVPWGGMDGTTSGPLNSWFLFTAHALGVPLGYRWAHMLAAGVLATTSVMTYATLRLVSGRAAAAAGVFVAVLWIALAQGANFTHFTSELAPALLASAALFCLAARLKRPRHGVALDLLAGVLLGLVPWTKLQAVLGAAVLWLWIARQNLRGAGDEKPRRPRRLLLFALATALPGVLILGIVLAGGAWRDFWMSYVIANASYATGSDVTSVARKVFYLFQSPSSRLLAGLLLFAGSWWALGRPGWSTASGPAREFLLATVMFAGATLLAVLTPPYPFPHYQILLLQPLALIAGCIASMWVGGAQPVGSRRLAGALFVACLLALPLTGAGTAIAEARATHALRAASAHSPARRIARRVLSDSPEPNGLAVWGWMPSLFMETGIPPATRHAISHFLIEPSPARDHLRASFLADIRREKPAWIIDAVADGCFRWRWDSAERLASFPELDEYVRQNYVLAFEQQFGGGSDPVRGYQSRDSRGPVIPQE